MNGEGGNFLIGGYPSAHQVKQCHHDYQRMTEGNDTSYRCFAHRMSILATARAIGVHRSTLYRELRRNAGPQGYQPDNAHLYATHRQGQCGQISAICRCHPVCRADTRLVVEPGADKRGGQADGPHGESRVDATAMKPPTKPGWPVVPPSAPGPQAPPARGRAACVLHQTRSIETAGYRR